MKRLALLAVLLLTSSCTTDSDDARKTLYKAGFTDVQVGGVDLFSCGEHDYMGRKFTAKNPQGVVVDGTVCCAMLKKCTIRF